MQLFDYLIGLSQISSFFSLDTICIYLPANMLLKCILFGHLHVNQDTLADVTI